MFSSSINSPVRATYFVSNSSKKPVVLVNQSSIGAAIVLTNGCSLNDRLVRPRDSLEIARIARDLDTRGATSRAMLCTAYVQHMMAQQWNKKRTDLKCAPLQDKELSTDIPLADRRASPDKISFAHSRPVTIGSLVIQVTKGRSSPLFIRAARSSQAPKVPSQDRRSLEKSNLSKKHTVSGQNCPRSRLSRHELLVIQRSVESSRRREYAIV